MLFLFLALSVFAQQPNPPKWPSNVYVFDPASSSQTQTIVDQIYAENGGHNPPFNGQWSNSRYALLFKPGTHNVKVNVGYYTSIIGLGTTPSDTHIGTIVCENGDYDYTGGALANFWRSAENFYTSNNMLWAVSQAVPLRRAYIQGNLDLYQYNSGCCAGYASGGYMSDTTVTGTITFGSQQQWFTRNTRSGAWNGGVWNMVFVGCAGAPGTHCSHTGGGPYTTVANTPVIAEKPYITIDAAGKYYLQVPKVEMNKNGPTTNYGNVDTFDFANVYVATEADSAATITSRLSSGLHVVLSPGNYKLDDSINVTKANTYILGIGFPTLIANNGHPAIIVSNVDGVRVAGVLLQAGEAKTSALLQWGSGTYAGSSSNPGFLYDVFARVGGTNDPSQFQVQADVMVEINSGNVVYDNSWLWRADHGVSGSVYNGDNPNLHGLVVNGANVTTYALAVEHQLNDLVQWNGENGKVYYYQSELPYDVTEANYGQPGYVGFRVASSVQNHQNWGAGVYSYYRDNAVTTTNAIMTGTSSGIHFVNSFTCFLNGLGQITHVIDNQGAAVNTSGQQTYVCNYN